MKRTKSHALFVLVFIMTALLIFSLVGCSGRDKDAPLTTIVTGTVMKGPVRGATVTVYELTGDNFNGIKSNLPEKLVGYLQERATALGSSPTDGQGRYNISLGGAYTGRVAVVAVGGTYDDENKDAQTDSTKGFIALSSGLAGAMENVINITPVTTVAAYLFCVDSGVTAIDQANAKTADMLGLTDIDIITTTPIDIFSGDISSDSDIEAKYTKRLAQFSRLSLAKPTETSTDLIASPDTLDEILLGLACDIADNGALNRVTMDGNPSNELFNEIVKPSMIGTAQTNAGGSGSRTPGVSLLWPGGGNVAGGETVKIVGCNLKNTVGVRFGVNVGRNLKADDTVVEVTVPAGAAGSPVDVVIAGSDFPDDITLNSAYNYYAQSADLTGLSVTDSKGDELLADIGTYNTNGPDYVYPVDSAVDTVSVTPDFNSADVDSVQVNGIPVSASGDSVSIPVTYNDGSTPTVQIVVSAAGKASKTYKLRMKRSRPVTASDCCFDSYGCR